MPELPEVQTVVDDLRAAGLVGRRITFARVLWHRTVADTSPRSFCRRIRGVSITGIRRRGKFIVMELSDGRYLLIHLRMTGRIELVRPRAARRQHTRVVLDLGGDLQLRFSDPRKFGRMQLIDNPDAVLGRLGPEPLARGFTARRLAAALRSRNRILKPLLLDQRFIAGLGNIYADEALWEAGLHPQRRSQDLDEHEITVLHRAIRKVLRRGLRNLGTTLGRGGTTFYSVAGRKGRNRDALKVFRRTDMPCPRCKNAIVRIVVGQRSTHLCPRCQRTATRPGA